MVRGNTLVHGLCMSFLSRAHQSCSLPSPFRPFRPFRRQYYNTLIVMIVLRGVFVMWDAEHVWWGQYVKGRASYSDMKVRTVGANHVPRHRHPERLTTIPTTRTTSRVTAIPSAPPPSQPPHHPTTAPPPILQHHLQHHLHHHATTRPMRTKRT